MLGVAGGALFRRLLPAMAVTLVVFFVVLFTIMGLRGDYATPDRVVQDVKEEVGPPAGDTLLVDTGWLAPDGTESTAGPLSGCGRTPREFQDCVRESGYRMVTYVHPADRYWRACYARIYSWSRTVRISDLTLSAVRRLLGVCKSRRLASRISPRWEIEPGGSFGLFR